MKKIPTYLKRDPNNLGRVLHEVTKGCEWVTAGQGIATQKLDGTACLIRGDGVLMKRRQVKPDKSEPPGFLLADHDKITGKKFGWVPLEATDKYHYEALRSLDFRTLGTYELVGPKMQGNPESYKTHQLIRHSIDLRVSTEPVPRSYDKLRLWLTGRDIEGIVFHHSDGRMAKIKLSDFGLKRAAGDR